MDKKEELVSTTKLVEDILTNDPCTRNNDDLLYVKVCQHINDISINLPFWRVMLNRNNYGFPAFETVRRARQRIQEKNPGLGSDVHTYIARVDNEEVFREYARG